MHSSINTKHMYNIYTTSDQLGPELYKCYTNALSLLSMFLVDAPCLWHQPPIPDIILPEHQYTAWQIIPQSQYLRSKQLLHFCFARHHKYPAPPTHFDHLHPHDTQSFRQDMHGARTNPRYLAHTSDTTSVFRICLSLEHWRIYCLYR